jgi:hypothetical protein
LSRSPALRPALSTQLPLPQVNTKDAGYLGCYETSAWPSAFPKAIYNVNRSGMNVAACRFVPAAPPPLAAARSARR